MERKSLFIRNLGFFASIITAVFLCISVSLLPVIEESVIEKTTTPQFQETPISATTLTPMPINISTSTPAKQQTLTFSNDQLTIIGLRNFFPQCINGQRPWAEISGFEISGGVPPYEVVLSQSERILYKEVFTPSINETQIYNLSLAIPVPVVTGELILVTINSKSSDGSLLSISSNLVFPIEDPSCLQ